MEKTYRVVFSHGTSTSNTLVQASHQEAALELALQSFGLDYDDVDSTTVAPVEGGQ